MIAALYARKSTDQSDRADEEKSVTRQVERGTAYIQRKGWTLAPEHIYTDDGISGAEFQRRPDFLRLMNALKPRAAFQVLVMMDEDRLGREQIETAWALKQLIVAGVRVFSYLTDRERTLDSPTEKLMLSVTAFADEMEREKARMRTHDAHHRKAEAGHVTGGVVYGYENVVVYDETRRGADGQRKRSHVIRRINPAEAAVVRELFEGYVAGRGLTRLAKALNARHVPPPRGGAHGWAGSAIREILKRELYRGVIVWNQSQKCDRWGKKHPRRRPESEWLRVEAPDLRIVAEDLWQAAQQRRARIQRTTLRVKAGDRDAKDRPLGGRLRGRPSAEDFVSPYLLTGLARCGECGGPLAGFTRSHGRRRQPFYACAYHVKRGRTICRNSVPIRQEVIERAFLDALAVVFDARMIEDAVSEARAKLRRDGDQRLEQRDILVRERSLIEARIRHILDAVKAGHATIPLLQELEREEARKGAIATELAKLADLERVTSLNVAQVSRELTSLAADVHAVVVGAPGPARQMLRKLFAGHQIQCVPFVDPDGARGYHFRAEGSYAALLAGRVATDGRVPEGIRTRARGLAPLGTVKDVTLGPELDKGGLKRPTALAASGPRKRSGTSGYPDPSRGPDRSTTGQVSMKGNGSGRRLWNCLVGRHHGDMEIYGRGMIRADR
jgi:site-specific DNA recombinase